jgi:hypothetical protein
MKQSTKYFLKKANDTHVRRRKEKRHLETHCHSTISIAHDQKSLLKHFESHCGRLHDDVKRSRMVARVML